MEYYNLVLGSKGKIHEQTFPMKAWEKTTTKNKKQNKQNKQKPTKQQPIIH